MALRYRSCSLKIFLLLAVHYVNVHGRDIRHEALIDTVDSFRLLMADGTVRNVSREENAELFPYVIGVTVYLELF